MFICPLKDRGGAFHLFKSWTGISSPEVLEGLWVLLVHLTSRFSPQTSISWGGMCYYVCSFLSCSESFLCSPPSLLMALQSDAVWGCRQDGEAWTEHKRSSVVTPFCSLCMLHFSFCGLWRYDLVCVGSSTEGKCPGMKSKVVTITSGI